MDGEECGDQGDPLALSELEQDAVHHDVAVPDVLYVRDGQLDHGLDDVPCELHGDYRDLELRG